MKQRGQLTFSIKWLKSDAGTVWFDSIVFLDSSAFPSQRNENKRIDCKNTTTQGGGTARETKKKEEGGEEEEEEENVSQENRRRSWRSDTKALA